MKLLLIAASLVLGVGGAQANTLDFGTGPNPPTFCGDAQGGGPMVACAPGVRINQGYGDVAGVVDVTCSQPLQTDARSLDWYSTCSTSAEMGVLRGRP
jgi:hypothetical protein